MSDSLDRLKSMNNNKLIDVVKNYRQYGYSEELRNEALRILESRGIDEFALKLTGNFQNETYNRALMYYEDFQRNSKVAFILYLILILGTLFIPLIVPEFNGVDLFITLFNLAVFIAFLTFLVKSFINQSQFYKSNRRDVGAEGALLYIILGMPLYFLMYFYFKKQMKELMKTIN